MGIDIYMHWDGQTDEEKKLQYNGFNTWAGHVGYLREAYHGDPYATRVLVPEAFADDREHTCGDGDEDNCVPCSGVAIPAEVLQGRVEAVGAAVIERYTSVYGEDPTSEDVLNVLKSFGDFVKLAEQKERETGVPVRVLASY